MQIAYGFIALVDDLTGYDPRAMTLFDYRTDFVGDDAAWQRDVEMRPTFMYAMPLGRLANGTHRVFFEETSLVRWLRDLFASPLRLSFGALLSYPTRLNTLAPTHPHPHSLTCVQVGRGRRRLSFAECKRRAFRRLEHLGMKVLGIEEVRAT
jgi:hypothetical protein